MARPKSDRPNYLKHKQSGRGYVAINGKQTLLPGAFGSKESQDAYNQLLSTWYKHGRALPDVPAEPAAETMPTVAMLCLTFWKDCEHRYLNRNGEPTGEGPCFKHAMQPLKRMFGSLPIKKFSSYELLQIRKAMIRPHTVVLDDNTEEARPGWSRGYANAQIGRIRRIFQWGTLQKFDSDADEMIVPANVYLNLKLVVGLKEGEYGVREQDEVKAVDRDVVLATLPYLSPPVAAMVQLQMFTGARGGELFKLRTSDIDRSGNAVVDGKVVPVWKYRPALHKTSKKKRKRVIMFGPKSQAVLAPFFKLELSAPLFSPADGHAWRNEKAKAGRKTPMTPSQVARAKRAAKHPRELSPIYTKDSYAQAVARGAEKAGVAHWHPHQLRHLAGTVVRKSDGIEAASMLLDHASIDMTEEYAERDESKVAAIIARIG